MVLSLPVPSFSRSASSSPLRTGDNDASSHHHHRGTKTKTTAGKTSGKSSSASHLLTNATNGSTTLSEALRNNPFGSTSRTRAALEAQAQAEQQQQRERERQELNDALVTLAQLFPDVKVEVFRELLVRFDGQSRLQVCVEQLLRYKKEWVKGRWNVPEGRVDARNGGGGAGNNNNNNGEDLVPPEERFRSEEYKAAVKTALSKEFSGLSRSTIDAVLAEVNFSYTRARPTLRNLSRKTWRATIGSLLPFKRKKDRDKDDHPLLLWQRLPDGELTPKLKETGCEELDRELHETLLEPLLRQRKEERESRDLKLAEELNESEAKAVHAMYECDCCLADVTFEQISTCSASSHVICYSCIQRTIHEALFGQGWNTSVDPGRSTLRCLAPVTEGTCEGFLPPEIVKRAVLCERAGAETYRKFEDRLASEALLKSQLKLIRCPFCSYAEVDPVYHPSAKGITWRFRRGNLISTILMTILLLDLIPLLIIPVLVVLLFNPSAVTAVLNTSLRNLCLKTRNQRFTCANPECKRDSCITCHKPWNDPHVCHEPLLLSLRTTIEAARTAAVKRTCPRCGLSFVKSSGCNKLTCVCGYSMCYLCRKALGPPLKRTGPQQPRRRRRRQQRGRQNPNPHPPRPNQENEPPTMAGGGGAPDFENNDMEQTTDGEEESVEEEAEEEEEEEEEGEGYKHFCEHFRINPGSRCTECNKCDLYLAEDEEEVARRAGEEAEREWRIRQGMVGVNIPSSSSLLSSSFPYGDEGTNRKKKKGWDWDDLFRFNDPKWWRRRWRYWVEDVWREGRWKLEGQALVDWVVEKVVVVEDV